VHMQDIARPDPLFIELGTELPESNCISHCLILHVRKLRHV
jgi:hypothetical protein